MLPDPATLVARSHAAVRAAANIAAPQVYGRLVALAPYATAPLLALGETGRREKLLATVDAIALAVTDPPAMVPAAVASGGRHHALGVGAHDYDLFADLLLDAVGTALGPGFDEATRLAWREGAMMLTAVMRRSGARASGEWVREGVGSRE